MYNCLKLVQLDLETEIKKVKIHKKLTIAKFLEKHFPSRMHKEFHLSQVHFYFYGLELSVKIFLL